MNRYRRAFGGEAYETMRERKTMMGYSTDNEGVTATTWDRWGTGLAEVIDKRVAGPRTVLLANEREALKYGMQEAVLVHE